MYWIVNSTAHPKVPSPPTDNASHCVYIWLWESVKVKIRNKYQRGYRKGCTLLRQNYLLFWTSLNICLSGKWNLIDASINLSMKSSKLWRDFIFWRLRSETCLNIWLQSHIFLLWQLPSFTYRGPPESPLQVPADVTYPSSLCLAP